MSSVSTEEWHRIAHRILTEYKKYHIILPDEWHKIAAKKIYAEFIKDKKTQLKDLQKHCRRIKVKIV